MKTPNSFTVTEAAPLLEFLLKNLPMFKRTKVKQILKFGSVRVNGSIITSHARALKPGDKIELLSEKQARVETLKLGLDINIVYEDEDVIVTEKEAGLLTMGSETDKVNTLYHSLTDYERSKSKDGRGRVYIVHRLDKDSSGLIVFAKNEKAKRALQENWETSVKKYYAITEGIPAKKFGTIESHLVEDKFRRVYSIQKQTHLSKHAVTHYRILRTGGGYALLEVSLDTGRKNQIRVHLADMGHPIVGDAKYGAVTDPIHRVALHSFCLSFIHPTTQKSMIFQSQLPPSFNTLLE